MESNERLTLSVIQAGAVLGLSPSTSYRLVHTGEIPSLRLGRQLRVPKVQLEKLLAGQQTGQTATEAK